jgi:hypothetical protein
MPIGSLLAVLDPLPVQHQEQRRRIPNNPERLWCDLPEVQGDRRDAERCSTLVYLDHFRLKPRPCSLELR